MLTYTPHAPSRLEAFGLNDIFIEIVGNFSEKSSLELDDHIF